MLELFPGGFEERDHADGLELVAYTDDAGEERLWAAFGEVTAIDVPGGWEDRWREFHKPVRIGRLWVGPPWEPPPVDGEAIVVDPGRAFGTGGHATTRLCLQLLAELEPRSLLDAGCGSGVLAIAAARLGFAPVTALDHDPKALEATARNAAANGVSVECRLGDRSRRRSAYLERGRARHVDEAERQLRAHRQPDNRADRVEVEVVLELLRLAAEAIPIGVTQHLRQDGDGSRVFEKLAV